MHHAERLACKGKIRPPEREIEKHRERSPFLEQYRMIPDAIAVSGPSGTGKTTFTEELIKRLPGVTPFYGGEWFRERTRERKGESAHVVGFERRPRSLDEELDDYQKDRLRKTNTEGKKEFHEARLAIVNATEVMNESENPDPPHIIRILWVADNDVRLDRIVSRELQRQKENPNLRRLTPKEIRENTLKREAGDLKHWAHNHEILKTGKIDKKTGEEILLNPYDPSVIGPDGEPLFYDYCMDTTDLSLLESVVEAISLLEEKGHIVKIDDKKGAPSDQDQLLYPIFP